MRADRLADAIRENVDAWYTGKRTHEAFRRFQSRLWMLATVHGIADDVARIVAPRFPR